MGKSISLGITKNLRAFLNASSGDESSSSTPNEFVLALIRQEMERVDASDVRRAVLQGYDDVLQGRTRKYTGDLRAMLEQFRAE